MFDIVVLQLCLGHRFCANKCTWCCSENKELSVWCARALGLQVMNLRAIDHWFPRICWICFTWITIIIVMCSWGNIWVFCGDEDIQNDYFSSDFVRLVFTVEFCVIAGNGWIVTTLFGICFFLFFCFFFIMVALLEFAKRIFHFAWRIESVPCGYDWCNYVIIWFRINMLSRLNIVLCSIEAKFILSGENIYI